MKFVTATGTLPPSLSGLALWTFGEVVTTFTLNTDTLLKIFGARVLAGRPGGFRNGTEGDAGMDRGSPLQLRVNGKFSVDELQPLLHAG